MSEQVQPPASKKAPKKEGKKEVVPVVSIPENAIRLYPSNNDELETLKILSVAVLTKKDVHVVKDVPKELESSIITFPTLQHEKLTFFGANTIIRYLAVNELASSANASRLNDLIHYEELTLQTLLKRLAANSADEDAKAQLSAAFQNFENTKEMDTLSPVLPLIYYKTFTLGLSTLGEASFPYLASLVKKINGSEGLAEAKKRLTGGNGGKAAGKKEKAAAPVDNRVVVMPEIVKPTIPTDFDWESAGIVSSLHVIFDAAILAAFPTAAKAVNLEKAIITRCGNPQYGDFQCNNALSLSKALKTLEGYNGPVSPKDIAECIIKGIPENPIISGANAAPNGFINIFIALSTMVSTLSNIVTAGDIRPPYLPKKTVLVDFSSPNIAKEMHVGHLRSTIIGDSISRLLEFVNYTVYRVNHVGDWGTQFGMLISFLLEEYPDILTNPPNISDLTAIYKNSKQKFDADEQFKEKSRKNVVNLQSGDSTCRAIWNLLCDISRKEFSEIYKALDITIEEFGESFYNAMIPGAIQDLTARNLVVESEGMLVVKLDHFTIPLILRKSDGGYGYDSTDMAALQYRLHEKQCDWIIYITDLGQQPHFHMCFDAGRAAGWLTDIKAKTGRDVRLDHVGFGVVCGENGKRFKTRSSETVRLIDLLNVAKDTMYESLKTRNEENNTSLSVEEMEEAAKCIGYGAIKYFDLKQHPATNYIFDYGRMLDTRGDTAVYLMFAYARLASILRKAKEDRNIDIDLFKAAANSLLVLEHPSERALAFEILQFGDMIKNVITELLPNRLCDYLKEVCVKFTDFVTKCHVLNAKEENLVKSRLLLCQATKLVMAKCFALLGIKPLERI